MEVWQTIVQDRERGARQLVSEFGNRLLGAAVLLCRDGHLAEDLVFRTLDQAVKKIRLYRPTGDFYGWLYTILLNYWRMDLRRSQPDIVLVGTAADLPPVAAALAPETIRMASDDDIHAALNTLPPPIRVVVVLKYFREMSIEEIARTLDIPEGTVKSRLHNARKALCAALGRNCGERRSLNDGR